MHTYHDYAIQMRTQCVSEVEMPDSGHAHTADSTHDKRLKSEYRKIVRFELNYCIYKLGTLSSSKYTI